MTTVRTWESVSWSWRNSVCSPSLLSHLGWGECGFDAEEWGLSSRILKVCYFSLEDSSVSLGLHSEAV